MALMECPDCGKEISDAAPLCIHCGRPNAGPRPEPGPEPPQPRALPWGLACTWLGGLGLASGLVLLVAGRPGAGALFFMAGLALVFLGGVHAVLKRFKR